MATYKEIFGTNIEVLASDPANPVEGQVWYNSTSNVVKGFIVTTAGAWATANDMNTGRIGIGDAGSQTAALGFAGNVPPVTAITESWNGTSWTEVNDLNTARESIVGAGTQTSALGYGGNGPPEIGVTETWNGTSWTEVNDMNTSRVELAAATVTNTAALGFGGNRPPGTNPSGLTESWNGTTWTEVNDLNTARGLAGTGGPSTSAILAGGSGWSNASEEWGQSGGTQTITTS